MYKILFATGQPALDEAIMRSLSRTKEYLNCGYVDYKEALLPKVKDVEPDIIVLSDDLSGNIDTLSMVLSIKQEFKYTRLVFLTYLRYVGDPLLKNLVTYNVYDFIADDTWRLSDIINLITHPRAFADVQTYLLDTAESDDKVLEPSTPQPSKTATSQEQQTVYEDPDMPSFNRGKAIDDDELTDLTSVSQPKDSIFTDEVEEVRPVTIKTGANIGYTPVLSSPDKILSSSSKPKRVQQEPVSVITPQPYQRDPNVNLSFTPAGKTAGATNTNDTRKPEGNNDTLNLGTMKVNEASKGMFNAKGTNGLQEEEIDLTNIKKFKNVTKEEIKKEQPTSGIDEPVFNAQARSKNDNNVKPRSERTFEPFDQPRFDPDSFKLSEERSKVEDEIKAKAEAEKARLEEEVRLKEEARKKQEAQEKARLAKEQERKAEEQKRIAEQLKLQKEKEAKEKAEREAKIKAEQEAKAKEEARKKAEAEKAKKQAEEMARKQAEEAARKQAEEARRAKEEAEKKKKEELERQKRAEKEAQERKLKEIEENNKKALANINERKNANNEVNKTVVSTQGVTETPKKADQDNNYGPKEVLKNVPNFSKTRKLYAFLRTDASSSQTALNVAVALAMFGNKKVLYINSCPTSLPWAMAQMEQPIENNYRELKIKKMIYNGAPENLDCYYVKHGADLNYMLKDREDRYDCLVVEMDAFSKYLEIYNMDVIKSYKDHVAYMLMNCDIASANYVRNRYGDVLNNLNCKVVVERCFTDGPSIKTLNNIMKVPCIPLADNAVNNFNAFYNKSIDLCRSKKNSSLKLYSALFDDIDK